MLGRVLHGLSARKFFSELWRRIRRDDATNLAAQLAYWDLLALFPFFIFLFTIVGFIHLGSVQGQVMEALERVMPPAAAQVISCVLDDVVQNQHGWLLVVSIVGSLWSASSAMTGLISALNHAADCEESRPAWKVYAIAIGMTVGCAVLIVIATFALAIGSSVGLRLWSFIGLGHEWTALWQWLRWPVAVVAMMLALACIYWVLPAKKRPFRFISPGAVVAVLLWIAVSIGFGLYVSHFSSYARIYGTLGGLIVLLTWLYLSGFVVILGGEVNAVLDCAADEERARA